MRVVLAPDKFRGSLRALEAARALEAGVRRACPGAACALVPMADGGEGTAEALVDATGGRWAEAQVTGPLGERRRARFGLLGDGRTAVLEMAEASGNGLVPPGRRDPERTTTRGTGELAIAAARAGARALILGIGGSATNDGGAGFAQALGYRLLDDEGAELLPGGGALGRLHRIVPPESGTPLDGIALRVACDVQNPLCGPDGASAVYGPQKGATPAQVQRLDANLLHLAAIIERDLGRRVATVPGAGAAGGLGAGLLAFTDAQLRPGVDLVIDAVGLVDRLRGAVLCLTGEGAIDRSSAFGKTVAGVARAARREGVPVLALGGTLGPGFEVLHNHGVAACFSLCSGPMPLDVATRRAAELLAQAAEQATRAFLAGRGIDVDAHS
jgi:glycerate kinase